MSIAATAVAPDSIKEKPARGDLSVFLATAASDDPLQTYRGSLQSLRTAETLGYGYAWVAEAHFSANIAIPVALAFLSAAAQITERMQLGTAVVPLGFDNPLRLAESAALVNALSDERLEFGVGKGNPRGFSTDAYNAFGLDEGRRDEIFADTLDAVKRALVEPVTVGEKQLSIYPPAGNLLDRIWQATGDLATATAAGAAGDGLLLFRTVPEGIAGDVQLPLAEGYLEALANSGTGHQARIGVSRSILIGSSREEAIATAKTSFESRSNQNPFGPESTDTASVEEWLVGFDVAFGTIDQIVETLNNDATVSRATNYLLSLPFSETGSSAYLEGLEAVATEIYPRLRHQVS